MIDITSLDKEGLKAYAASGSDFSAVELDMRKSLVSLRDEVKALQDSVIPALSPETPKPINPGKKFIKNKKTGLIFEQTKLNVAYLAADGIECDKDGNPV